MAQQGAYYPNQDLVNAPTTFQAPVVIGNAGGSLAVQSGVPVTQYGTSVTPAVPPATASGSYTTAAGQPGYVNPQGMQVLDSGVIQGSVLTGPGTVASSVAETQLVGGTIRAGDPVATAVYLIRGAGTFSVSGTPTLTFTLRYGAGTSGTSMAAIPATAAGSTGTNYCWDAEGIMTVYSPTQAVGTLRVGIGTSGVTDAASFYVNSSTAPTAIVSNIAKAFALDFAWGTSSASNTLTTFTGYAMRLA